MPILLMIISVIQSDGFMSIILPETQLYLPAYSNHFKRTTTSLPYYQTQPYSPVYTNHFTITNTSLLYYWTHVLTCLQKPPYNNIHLSTILPETQLYLSHNLPTAITLQQHPPVYHTTRDTTVFTCLQQPPNNNIHLSTILPETRLYLLAYSNHLTITSTCLPYFQRHKYTYLPAETTLQ